MSTSPSPCWKVVPTELEGVRRTCVQLASFEVVPKEPNSGGDGGNTLSLLSGRWELLRGPNITCLKRTLRDFSNVYKGFWFSSRRHGYTLMKRRLDTGSDSNV